MVASASVDPDAEAFAELEQLAQRSRRRDRQQPVTIGQTIQKRAAGLGVTDEPEKEDPAPPQPYQQALREAERRNTEPDPPSYDEAFARRRRRCVDRARQFIAKNWSVVPAAAVDKKAKIAYKPYCKRIARPAEIAGWAEFGNWCDLAIALGPASGPAGYSLAAIDLDSPEAAEAWKAQAGDLSDCYVVETRRGLHVYFLVDTKAVTGCYHKLWCQGEQVGELRVNGVITMAPGTLHEKSTPERPIVYQGRGPLPNAHDLRIVPSIGAILGDAIREGTLLAGARKPKLVAMLGGSVATAQQSAFAIEVKGRIAERQGAVLDRAERFVRTNSLSSRLLANAADIDWWLDQTTPTSPGSRDDETWNASRYLIGFGDWKLIEEEAEQEPDILEDLFARWHAVARKRVQTEHSEDDTIEAFWRSIRKVEVPADAGRFAEAQSRALFGDDPPCFAEIRQRFARGFSAPNTKALRLLHELQELRWSNQPEPLYISQRRLAEFLGVTRQAVGPKFDRWIANDVIELARAHVPGKYAARYWFKCRCFTR